MLVSIATSYKFIKSTEFTFTRKFQYEIILFLFVIISRTSHILTKMTHSHPLTIEKMMDLGGAIKVCNMYLWTQNALIIHSRRKKESVSAASQGFNHLVQHDLLTGNPSPKSNNSAFQRAFSLSLRSEE